MFSPEIAADRALQAHGWKGGHIDTEATGLICVDVTVGINLTIAADGNIDISGSSAEAGGHFNLDIGYSGVLAGTVDQDDAGLLFESTSGRR
jgi:hypothetical protein